MSLTGYSSVNPTTVNGRALRPVEDEEGGMSSSIGATAVLRDGDSFTIADRPFRFEYNAGTTTTRQDLAAQRRWGRPSGWLAGWLTDWWCPDVCLLACLQPTRTSTASRR